MSEKSEKFDIGKWLKMAKPATTLESHPWLKLKPPKGKKKFGYLLKVISKIRSATIYKKERSVIDVEIVDSNDSDVNVGEVYAVSGTRTVLEGWIAKTKPGEVYAVANHGKREAKDGTEYWFYMIEKVEVNAK